MPIKRRRLGNGDRSMGRETDVVGLVAQRITVGATPLAFNPIRGQEGWLLKYQALGGTLEILGSTFYAGGLSYPVSAAGAGYLMDVGESISIDGPAAFYMASQGSTSAVMVVRTLTAGFNTQL